VLALAFVRCGLTTNVLEVAHSDARPHAHDSPPALFRRAVAAAMSNNASFSDDTEFCWTAVDDISACDVPGYYKDANAVRLVIFSLLLGVFGGGSIGFLVFKKVLPSQRALSMASYLTNYPGSINQFSETVMWSRYFCVSEHHTETDLMRLKKNPTQKKPISKWKELGKEKPAGAQIFEKAPEQLLNRLKERRLEFTEDELDTLEVPYDRDIYVKAGDKYFQLGSGERHQARQKHKEFMQNIKSRVWTKPDDETLNAEVLGVDYVWRRKRFEKSTVSDMCSTKMINKMRWLSGLKVEEDAIPKQLYDEWEKAKILSKQRADYDSSDDEAPPSNAPGASDTKAGDKHLEKALPSWVTSGAKYQKLRYGFLPPKSDGSDEFVLVARSGGVIRDIDTRCSNGATAPTFLQALNLRGQVRVHFVKPITGSDSHGMQADSDHQVMIFEQPVLQHGAVVDLSIWKEELSSGRLKVFHDKRGVRMYKTYL
jgi:hypothetical protein